MLSGVNLLTPIKCLQNEVDEFGMDYKQSMVDNVKMFCMVPIRN